MSHYTEDDYIHTPTDHPKWQESFVLVFRDLDTDLVGFLRVGAYVNEKRAQTHFGLATGDGLRFRRHRLDLPLNDGDRQHGCVTSGTLTYSIVDDSYIRFQGEEDEASFDLRLYDFFPSVSWRIADPRGQEIAETVGGFNHPEASGRLTGRVRIGDRTIDIENGLAHRDHAWGPRDHASILNNRWVAGTVGPELSFSCMTVQHGNGDFVKAAWVVRDGMIEYAKDVNILAIVLPDGISTIGGWTEILLDSGERISLRTEVIDGIITSSHLPNGGPGSTPAGVEGIAKAMWSGKEGVCDFNINVNPLNGEQPVTKLTLANHDEGLTVRDPSETEWAFRLLRGS